MIKKIVGIITLVMLVASLVGCGSVKDDSSVSKKEKNVETKIYNIGITQIVEHPALDASKKGFVDALKEKGYEDGVNVSYDEQNAQGDMGTNQLIASNFVNDKKDMIFAISTPSAQASYNATKDIPIIITAVTDAVEAKLVESNKKTNTNVAGTSDMSPVDVQIDLALKVLPNAKKIGVLYNTSEVNSTIQVSLLKEVAAKYGLEVIEKGVTATNEIPDGVNSIIKDIDFLYIPTDNLMVSSLPIIIDVADKNNKAVVGAEENSLEKGYLLTAGVDYYNLGYQTGLMAAEVLEGKNISEMSIETLKDTKIVVNTSKAEKLAIEIPSEILDKAVVLK